MVPLSHLLNTTVRIQLKLRHVTLFLWQAEHLLVLSPRGSLRMRFHIMKQLVSLQVPRTIHLPRARIAVHTAHMGTMGYPLILSISGTSLCLMNNCYATCSRVLQRGDLLFLPLSQMMITIHLRTLWIVNVDLSQDCHVPTDGTKTQLTLQMPLKMVLILCNNEWSGLRDVFSHHPTSPPLCSKQRRIKGF